jgi:hypothetical protein
MKVGHGMKAVEFAGVSSQQPQPSKVLAHMFDPVGESERLKNVKYDVNIIRAERQIDKSTKCRETKKEPSFLSSRRGDCKVITRKVLFPPKELFFLA